MGVGVFNNLAFPISMFSVQPWPLVDLSTHSRQVWGGGHWHHHRQTLKALSSLGLPLWKFLIQYWLQCNGGQEKRAWCVMMAIYHQHLTNDSRHMEPNFLTNLISQIHHSTLLLMYVHCSAVHCWTERNKAWQSITYANGYKSTPNFYKHPESKEFACGMDWIPRLSSQFFLAFYSHAWLTWIILRAFFKTILWWYCCHQVLWPMWQVCQIWLW